MGELSNSVGLINNPHRYAGFQVLRAPDVPSVLVELGYLSNPKDEAQLRDPDWRDKAVTSIANAVAAFAASRRGAGWMTLRVRCIRTTPAANFWGRAKAWLAALPHFVHISGDKAL